MFHLYLIRGCPHCRNTIKLVKDEKLNASVNWVSKNEKDYYKQKHGMNTFPQIFYEGADKEMTLIGGYSDFSTIIKSIKKLNDYNLTTNTVSQLLYELS